MPSEEKKNPWAIATAPIESKYLEWICIASGNKDGNEWAKWAAYPPNDAIRKRLDEAFGPSQWSFGVVGHEITDVGDTRVVTVQGRLVIDGAHREQFGADSVGKKRGDTDFYKSAASRSFVKCAQMFGIGAECRDYPFKHTNGKGCKYNPPRFKPGQKGGSSSSNQQRSQGQNTPSSKPTSSANSGGARQNSSPGQGSAGNPAGDKPSAEQWARFRELRQSFVDAIGNEKKADEEIKALSTRLRYASDSMNPKQLDHLNDELGKLISSL